jgi:2-octaprenylphenol hydroxylase
MSAIFDIVIVGGGMAGCALACALADVDCKIVIVENQIPKPFSAEDFFDPRVVALSMASRQFLAHLGVWESIVAQRISAFDRMQVWDAEGTAQISFEAVEVQQPALGYIVENNLLVSVLRDRLQQQKNVQWLCPDAVVNLHDQNSADHATLMLNSGKEIQGKLIVAADGAQSLLRQLSGINTVEWDYGHSALVATVRTEKPHGAVARQRFITEGPLAFLPLRENRGW